MDRSGRVVAMSLPRSAPAIGTDKALRELLDASFGLCPDDLAGAVVSVAEQHMGAHDVVLLLVDLDQIELRPLEPTGGHEPVLVEGSPAGLAFREERVVIQRSGRERRLWLPVLDSAERLGVLAVVDDGTTELGDWVTLTSLVGELASSKQHYGDTINVLRRSGDLSLAAEMRWAMLPPLTFTSPQVTIAGVLQPSHLVAGDAFDYSVDRQTAALGIFDAMGHGLEASRIANLAVGGYRNGRRCGLPEADILAVVDDVISSQFGGARFSTAQVAVLDLERGAVRVLTAGHPPPLVLRTSGAAEPVSVRPGLPLGLGPSKYVEAVVQLEPGDALLMHSDGVTEARSPTDEEYGEARLAAITASLLAAGVAPAEVVRRAIREALDFQAGRIRDDATLLLLRWRPDAVGGPYSPLTSEPVELPPDPGEA
jgi:hypothetical protein